MKRLFLSLIMLFGLTGSAAAAAADTGADVNELNRQALIAVRGGNLPKLKELLNQGASVNTRNRFGDSLLLTAIKSGSQDAVDTVMAYRPDVNLSNTSQVTPLMAAAYSGNADAAKMLLDRRADVAAADRLHKTAMVYAAATSAAMTTFLFFMASPLFIARRSVRCICKSQPSAVYRYHEVPSKP